MATRATETIDNDGLAATYHNAEAGGDKIVPGPGVGIHVKNAHASPCNVTIVTPGTVDGLSVSDRVVAVPNGADRFIAVPDLYRNPADGLASITWAAETAVTFAVIRIN